MTFGSPDLLRGINFLVAVIGLFGISEILLTMSKPAEVVVCGAGIAGIATAFHLTRQGVRDVVLVDERPPLSLTSDKSTECYRNLWPGPGGDMQHSYL